MNWQNISLLSGGGDETQRLTNHLASKIIGVKYIFAPREINDVASVGWVTFLLICERYALNSKLTFYCLQQLEAFVLVSFLMQENCEALYFDKELKSYIRLNIKNTTQTKIFQPFLGVVQGKENCITGCTVCHHMAQRKMTLHYITGTQDRCWWRTQRPSRSIKSCWPLQMFLPFSIHTTPNIFFKINIIRKCFSWMYLQNCKKFTLNVRVNVFSMISTNVK